MPSEQTDERILGKFIIGDCTDDELCSPYEEIKHQRRHWDAFNVIQTSKRYDWLRRIILCSLHWSDQVSKRWKMMWIFVLESRVTTFIVFDSLLQVDLLQQQLSSRKQDQSSSDNHFPVTKHVLILSPRFLSVFNKGHTSKQTEYKEHRWTPLLTERNGESLE